MNEEWSLWESCPRCAGESALLRYGMAVMWTLFAVFLILRVPGLMEAPYFMLLAAVIFSAFYGGIGPSILSLSLCFPALFYLFLRPYFSLSLTEKLTFDEAARLIAFGWVALIISLVIAGSRRSRGDLRESEARYRDLIQSAPDAIATVNAQGLIIFVTPAAGKLFHCSCEKMLGLPLSMFVPGCFCQSHLTEMKDNLNTRKTGVAHEFTGRDLQGEAVPLEITFSTFKNGQNVFNAFMRDMRKGEPNRLSQKSAPANAQALISVADDVEKELSSLRRAFQEDSPPRAIQVAQEPIGDDLKANDKTRFRLC